MSILGNRILIYGMNFFPEFAGVGKYTGDIATYLATKGYGVVAVTTPPHYPGWKIFKGHKWGRWSTEEGSSVKILRCPLLLPKKMGGIWRFISPLSFAVTSAPVALWVAMTERPGIIVCIEPTIMVAPVALICAKLSGSRTVLHIQDLEIDAAFAVGYLDKTSFLLKFALKAESAIITKFDRIITISHQMARRLREKGVDDSKIVVHRNWVDLDAARPDSRSEIYRDQLNIAKSKFIVQYSGNLGIKQGIGLILGAAEALKYDETILFLVAGDGPMRGEAEEAMTVLPNLLVVGFQPEDRLGEFLAMADLHVLPQQADAADLVLPSKIGGMLASGRPIIAAAAKDTELCEFLQSCCTIIDPGNVHALVTAIRSHQERGDNAQSRQKRLELAGSLSREKIISKFADTVTSGWGR